MSFDDYLKKLGKTEAQLKEEIAKDNEAKIKNYLVLHEVAKTEKIEVADEEINAAMKNNRAGGEEKLSPEEEKREKEYWRQNLQTEKTFEFLEANFKKS
jgi:FKBP-type peptidyl-prolyl cis-trans isomerase (trigger factor)